MLNRLKKTDNNGFTIIEVMIVLAIAGLILLIVLLAVPALKRNARNTGIKSDANTLAGGISTYEGDNGGTPPSYFNAASGTVSIGTGSTDANMETVKIQGGTTVTTVTAAPSSVAPGILDVYPGGTCDGSPASARTIAIYYDLETTNGGHPVCVQG